MSHRTIQYNLSSKEDLIKLTTNLSRVTSLVLMKTMCERRQEMKKMMGKINQAWWGTTFRHRIFYDCLRATNHKPCTCFLVAKMMILYLSRATSTMVREDMKAATRGKVFTILKE